MKKLKEAEEKIPKGLGTPELAPVSTGLGEFTSILFTQKRFKNKYTAMDLRTMQDWLWAKLYGTAGVAEVNSFMVC